MSLTSPYDVTEAPVACVIHTIVYLLIMVAVGGIMAAGHTVANVIGASLSIYVILQIDDVVNDWINASPLTVTANNGQRLVDLRKKWRSDSESYEIGAGICSIFLMLLPGIVSWIVCLCPSGR